MRLVNHYTSCWIGPDKSTLIIAITYGGWTVSCLGFPIFWIDIGWPIVHEAIVQFSHLNRYCFLIASYVLWTPMWQFPQWYYLLTNAFKCFRTIWVWVYYQGYWDNTKYHPRQCIFKQFLWKVFHVSPSLPCSVTISNVLKFFRNI